MVKFDGSKGTKEMRLKDKHQRAHNFREGDNFNQTRLVTGADHRAPSGESVDDFYQGKASEGLVNLIKEPIDQYI